MLSQQRRSLGLDYDSATSKTPDPFHFALPPQNQHLLVTVPPTFQHQLLVRPPVRKHLHQHTTATSEYGWPSTSHQHPSRQTAKKVGRTSCRQADAMRHFTNSSSPPPSIQFTFSASAKQNSAFTFATLPPPAMALSFPPCAYPPRCLKRCRPLTDVDGERSCPRRKKRRLRLFLITSRLSPQYSQPATNIVDRGSSKIAVWAKQKALGRNLIRKAAILNRIRRQALLARDAGGVGIGKVLVEQEREQKQFELAKLAFLYGSHDTHTRPVMLARPLFPPTAAVGAGSQSQLPSGTTQRSPSPKPSSSVVDEAEESIRPSPNDAYCYALPRAQIPRRTHLPLPPSPLGLSNYDAFDLEDDIPDPYAHLDDEDESADQGMTDTDPRSSAATTSASFASTLPTAGAGRSETLKTPPQMIYSDFNILDPGEPVVGDMDSVDGLDGLDGLDAIWPSCPVPLPTPEHREEIAPPPADVSSPSTYSTSPNFTSVLETSKGSEAGLEQRPLKSMSARDNEINEERERQKSFMFLGFDP